mmetsp:Transcript_22009/g.51426  ORF Transcript_22009/g.51426 Transcript_22009/m.51426 type:complete len:145 (+) Transcript_22009:102-536(+)
MEEATCVSSSSTSADGCVQRRPWKHDADSEETTTPPDSSSGQMSVAEEQEYQQFVFPIALDKKCLNEEDHPSANEADDEEEDSEDEEEDEAPSKENLSFGESLMQSKMFNDPVEREKWKQRGWRAVQCCGGALLVLALIFDELD